MSAGRGNTLIVDDEADMRLLLLFTINNEDRGLRVVGEAASGEEALTIRRELDIDVIVLYSAYVDEVMADDARQIGIRRCVRKGDVPSLINAIRELTGLNIEGPAA